jgi:hypothetical protein
MRRLANLYDETIVRLQLYRDRPRRHRDKTGLSRSRKQPT